MKKEKYTREDVERDILMSNFTEWLGWVKNGKITRMGRLVVNQYPSGKLKKVI